MIKEYKDACFQNASLIPNWKQIDKNELCRLYVDAKKSDDSLADSYLSAILYKFWNVTEHNFHSQKYKVADEGECIDWTITGVLYALNHHVWDDPDNVLYEDEKGPEKAINTCIYSTKVNFYQRIKHQKEKLSYESLSLEQLMENASDSYYIPTYDKDNTLDNHMIDVIREAFYKKEYAKAFILDEILNDDVFERVIDGEKIYSQFSDKKLRKQLRKLDSNFCKRFSDRYDVDFSEVANSIHYVTDLDYSKLFIKVKKSLKDMQRDKHLKKYIMGDIC